MSGRVKSNETRSHDTGKRTSHNAQKNRRKTHLASGLHTPQWLCGCIIAPRKTSAPAPDGLTGREQEGKGLGQAGEGDEGNGGCLREHWVARTSRRRDLPQPLPTPQFTSRRLEPYGCARHGRGCACVQKGDGCASASGGSCGPPTFPVQGQGQAAGDEHGRKQAQPRQPKWPTQLLLPPRGLHRRPQGHTLDE